MAYFRFHRSVKLMPLIRLNVSRSGPSLSVGVNGARENLGAKGVRTTVGVPGTGLSSISQTSWGKLAKAQAGSVPTPSQAGLVGKGARLALAMVMLVVGIGAVAFGGLILWAIFTTP